MANKPQILATFKTGQAIGAVDHFTETMNWLVGFVANLKTDTGIEIKNQNSDHPTIKAKVIAGKGIKVEESGGAWKVSLEDGGGGDDDDDDSGSKGGKKGSGGSGGGGSSGQGGSGGGSGSGSNGSGSGGAGGSSGSDGSGDSGGSDDSSSDCNQFSDDLENGDGDAGMDNDGDLCSELNGW